MNPMVSDHHTPKTHEQQSAAMKADPLPLQSPWSPMQQLIRLVWGTAGRLIWILVPSGRSTLLRCFGATVGQRCRFARSVEVTIPWHLRMGDDCSVAEHAILYGLGLITLGDRVRIDTRAHLCAGSHDMRDTRFPLTRPPITVGADSFIGIDAFIAPGVTLGAGCIVHPRASVYRDVPDGVELRGNPAKAVT